MICHTNQSSRVTATEKRLNIQCWAANFQHLRWLPMGTISHFSDMRMLRTKSPLLRLKERANHCLSHLHQKLSLFQGLPRLVCIRDDFLWTIRQLLSFEFNRFLKRPSKPQVTAKPSFKSRQFHNLLWKKQPKNKRFKKNSVSSFVSSSKTKS